MRNRVTLALLGVFAVSAATTFAQGGSAPDPKAAAVIQELGLQEAAKPLRDTKGWKTPRKIVLTSMGPLEELKAIAPGVQFVVVNGVEQMLQEVADADAIASGDNLVCDDRVLAAAKKLRWVAVSPTCGPLPAR
jgi:hypothetical protein